MNLNFVQLDRQFEPISKTQEEAEHDEIRGLWGDSISKNWSQIEDAYRTVILAEAGAGKTEEMKERARRGVAIGRPSFFIRIEDIDIDFESAFEVGDSQSFGAWLASCEEAWFYLDSVDEARLKDPAAFRKAIQRFANRIKACSHRAHIVVSSRPYAWQPRADRAFLDEVLFLPAPQKSGESTDEADIEQDGRDQSALQIFRLKPLDKRRARVFADARKVGDFEKLWTEIERLDLADLAERPFDLEAIISKWMKDQSLDGRLKLLRHIIDQRLGEIDPDRERRQPLGLNKARDGARLLAAAVVLTGEAGIRVPDSAPQQSGIEAGKLLADWDPTEIRALLERAIFNDVIFGAVRFRHRETRELLAAEWFLELLKNGTSRHAVEELIFREQYGEEIVSSRLRPILPWLILFDDNIRRRALAIHPEIAVEGGDPAELPLPTRREILCDIVGRIASKQDHGTAGDNSAIARVAQKDLAGDALKLIEQQADCDDALFFLARLVWQGGMSNCVSLLLPIAADPKRRIHVRITSIRASMTCGTDEQKLTLWSLLLNAPADIPRELVTELVRHSSADAENVNLLLSALEKIAAYERYTASGLTRALHEFIDRLPIEERRDAVQPLALLISGFNGILGRAPYIVRGECHVSEKFIWLLGPATHAVEKLVSNRFESAMKPDSIAIMLKVPLARSWRGENFDDYKDKLNELVPSWPELNDHLFWENIDAVRITRREKNGEPLNDDWPIQWPGHYWSFESHSFSRVIQFIEKRTLEDDRLVALSLAYRIYYGAGKPPEWMNQLNSAVAGEAQLEARLEQLQIPPDRKWEEDEAKRKRRQERKRQLHEKDRSEWIARLKKNPDVVRNPPGLEPGDISDDQYWLLDGMEGGVLRILESQGADWRYLVKDFGDDVACAFREEAIAHWRKFRPGLRSEGAETGSIPNALIFAMVGLDIEALEMSGFPANLNERDLQHALRYITWELNGFPRWLEAMYRAFPEQVMATIQREVSWELENAQNGQSMYYIMHALAYYAPWLHPELVGPMIAWTRTHEVPNRDELGHILHILKSGGAGSDSMAALAKEKIAITQNSADLPDWYAMWVDAEANSGIVAIEEWLANLGTDQSSKAAQLFITALMGSRHDGDAGPHIGSFRTAKHLKSLYVLMHRYIRANNDINRAGSDCDSPELRRDAQDARNGLFNLLSEMPGKETYVALKELIEDHPDPDSRPWMAKRAYKRAEEDGDLEPWITEQVRQFEIDRTRMPTSHRQLFDTGVARLMDLKDWLERGNDSPYVTWQRVNGETEMRNLVTGWLNAHSCNRFSCAQENELANKQRTDIWIQSPGVISAVPIELKLLDQNWTGPKLCERLRNQLAGDYLREKTAGCGVMLLIWQGSKASRKWQIGGKTVGVSKLRNALVEYWKRVSDAFPHVSAIEIVVIDLTIRGSKSKG
jgi:hypothetical protein